MDRPRYQLDHNGDLHPSHLDSMAWAEWICSDANRTVRRVDLGHCRITTIFCGIDVTPLLLPHDTTPRFFLTIVAKTLPGEPAAFIPSTDRDEALATHQHCVEAAARGANDE